MEGAISKTRKLRFADFPREPAKFNTLPTVAIVVPNQENDMHNGLPETCIPVGDSWLKENLDALIGEQKPQPAKR